jgi:hypothetical protein
MDFLAWVIIIVWLAWFYEHKLNDEVPCPPPIVQTKLGASVESIQRDGLLMSKDYVEYAKTHDLTDGGVE